METVSSSAYTRLRNSLTEDFSEALSTQIILQNMRKCFIDLDNLSGMDYLRLVDAIISDYEMINPLGDNNISLKKEELIQGELYQT